MIPGREPVKHVLKATQDTFDRVKYGRIDAREKPDPSDAIFPGDTIEYQLVDDDTRKPIGPTLTKEVVKTSLHFPLEFNAVEDLDVISVLGFKAKMLAYPLDEAGAAVMLKSGNSNHYGAITSGAHNIDVRAYRPEFDDLEEGNIVGFEFMQNTGARHTVGRIFYKQDVLNLAMMYGDRLPEVLEKGLEIIGLAKDGIEGALEE